MPPAAAAALRHCAESDHGGGCDHAACGTAVATRRPRPPAVPHLRHRATRLNAGSDTSTAVVDSYQAVAETLTVLSRRARSDRRSRPGRVRFAVAVKLSRRCAVTGPGHAAAVDPQRSCCLGEVAMRPVRTIATVLFAAAVAVTGCTAHSTTAHPAAAPTPVSSAPPSPTTTPHPTPNPPGSGPAAPTPTTLPLGHVERLDAVRAIGGTATAFAVGTGT